ncbi:MAG: flagellar assembly protein FliW [Lachnospira sp.]|jgi:flagellar assembly factor FliW|nr:flagellar assembly protein FliW [Lachnospira sp.]
MRIQTKWFGEIEIDKDKVITFDRGIIGFDEFKQFTIVYDAQKDAQSSTMWLQSLDEVSLALPVIKPELIFEKYDPIVEDELINSLGENIKDAELLVLVTLTVTQDIKEMTCNLKAPIIINVDTMRGVQLIADNDDYMVRYPIYNILEQNSRKDGD